MPETTLLLLLNSTLQTLYMVFVSGLFTVAIGLPMGVVLFITRKGQIKEQRMIYQPLTFIVNVTRSIPFVILMITVIPLTRLLVGTSIGTNAAIVPLSLCAIPFFARIIENALIEVNKGLIEAAQAMGATVFQMMTKVMLPEALSSIINGFTLTIISLIGYSAMAGAVGGGGLGDVAIRYGYQRFEISVMLATIVIMVALVQIIQLLGDKLAKHFKRG